jgi:hypothetical protein
MWKTDAFDVRKITVPDDQYVIYLVQELKL